MKNENGRPFPVAAIFSKFFCFVFTIYFLYNFVGVMSSLPSESSKKENDRFCFDDNDGVDWAVFLPPKKSQEMRDDAATPSTSLITLLLLDPPNTTYSLTLGKKNPFLFFSSREKYVSPSLARFNDFTWSRVCSCLHCYYGRLMILLCFFPPRVLRVC